MKLLVFDIDGTLTNTQKVDDDCFIGAFQDEYGVTLTNTDWATFKNVTDTGLYNDLYFSIYQTNPNEEAKSKFASRFFSYMSTQLQAMPEKFSEVIGAKNFISFCYRQKDIKLGFATGAWSNSAKLKLNAANIFHSNVPLSTSDAFITRHSIVEDAIQQSKQKYQCHFDSVIYFGDGEWDYKTTKQLNIPFIGVDINNNGKLKALGATTIIGNYSDKDFVLKAIHEFN